MKCCPLRLRLSLKQNCVYVYLTQYEFGLSLGSIRFGLMKSPISYHVSHELNLSTCFYKTFVATIDKIKSEVH